MQEQEKRNIPEKIRLPPASSGAIYTCENPGVTRPGIETGSLVEGEQANRSATTAHNFSENAHFTVNDLPDPGSIPCRVAPGFSHVGIVPDDAVSRRVFTGISRFPPPFHSSAAPYSPQSPSSALKTSMLRAFRICSLTHAATTALKTWLASSNHCVCTGTGSSALHWSLGLPMISIVRTHHRPIGPYHTGRSYPVLYSVHYWPVINQWRAESPFPNCWDGFTFVIPKVDCYYDYGGRNPLCWYMLPRRRLDVVVRLKLNSLASLYTAWFTNYSVCLQTAPAARVLIVAAALHFHDLALLGGVLVRSYKRHIKGLPIL
ncbi:hypothetical protein PR048_019239 [Dryococelus australis]|uniref:Uncharacterized protein n=1 Tax=Dryococelus australis TaxID=614101 RepID=A0ABQ9H2X6_9NEOP|nr:hypothetical protein PR048_019239 [Dryococelus australis]